LTDVENPIMSYVDGRDVTLARLSATSILTCPSKPIIIVVVVVIIIYAFIY